MINQRGQPSRHRRGYLYAALALVTCPCHLPLLVLLFSGSAVGVLLTEHFAMAVTIFSLLFIFSLVAAVRVLRTRQVNDT